MLTPLLLILALVASGVGAGVLTAVAISVFPALCTMPPARYVETHRMMGKGFHPTMPIVFNIGMLAAFGAAALIGWPQAWLPLLAGLALAGSQAVSHLGNVPINRMLTGIEPGMVPADWQDPRPRWRRLNWLRTALALLGLLLLSVTAVAA